MKTYFSIDSYTHKKPSVLTLGAFDGLHLGHLKLIERVMERAKQKDMVSILLSFDPHPSKIINGKLTTSYLSTPYEKELLVKETKLDYFIIEPFTKRLAQLSPEDFIEKLLEKLHMKELIIGPNHYLGRNKQGDISYLKKLSLKYNFYLEILNPYKLKNQILSSSKIRRCLLEEKEGEGIQWANKALGKPYMLCGLVIKGDKLGRTIGFPTANIDVSKDKLLPRNGVYAVKIFLKGVFYLGMLNIGIRPTFAKNDLRVEVHIFDFNTFIYNEKICVLFLDKIREEKKFFSITELINQIKKDEKKIRQLFSLGF